MLLNDEGRTRFLDLYHRTLDAEFNDRRSETNVTFRGIIKRQAGLLREAIENATLYSPYLAR